MSPNGSSLERLEEQLGRLLLIGVVASATLLAAGLGFFLAHRGGAAADRLLLAGLVCLMATPLLRVVVSVVEYVRMRQWLFVLTTLVVLCELAVTLVYALGRR
jgi:uncharacterized membrane protein